MARQRLELVSVARFDDAVTRDHRIDDVPVVPAVSYLDLIWRAVRECGLGLDDYVLQNVLFKHPILLAPALDRHLQLSLTPVGEKDWKVAIASQTILDRKEILPDAIENLEADLVFRSAPAAPPEARVRDIGALKAEAVRKEEMSLCYGVARREGLNHLDFMRCLGLIHWSGRCLLADVQLGILARGQMSGFLLQPALMDAALLLSYGLRGTPGDRPFVPFFIDSMEVAGPIGASCNIYLDLETYQQKRQDFINLDLEILNERGERLVSLRKVSLKRLRSGTRFARPDRDTVVARAGDRVSPQPPAPSAVPQATVARRPSDAPVPGTQPDPSKGGPATADEIIDDLCALVAPLLAIDPEDVGTASGFFTLGLESTMLVGLVSELERRIGTRLTPTIFFEYDTIEALADHLAATHGDAYARSRQTAPSPVAVAAHEPSQPNHPGETPAPSAPGPAVETVREDIAIIGLSGRYPQAADIRAFWQVLAEGRDCIIDLPAERWDHSRYFDPDTTKKGLTTSKWGGFLDDVACFDPLFFQISPKEAVVLDPQERLFLETCHHLLEDAGYRAADLDPEGRVGVYVGVMWGHYELWNGEGERVAASNYWGIANRVSFTFNFNGPCFAVDSACSSSLTAIHLACRSLRDGESRVAIAGGVNLTLHPDKYRYLSQGRYTASDGRCRSFGEGGDGYVPGEGVGALLLKPLSRALADRDHIYGVIKGSAVNHGGRASGFTVPNPDAQCALVQEALRDSGVDPRTISYVEAHGTGTALGDPIEITALTKAFGPEAAARRACAIGSVKSNIGHLESAAGVAGVTKVLLQLQHEQLVPTLHAARVNPHIDFAATPFRLQQTLAPWPDTLASSGVPRRAGVSSFGAGGSNAHLILEAAPKAPPPADQGPDGPALILLSARDEDRLLALIRRFADFFQERPPVRLRDVATSLRVGREAQEYRLALVVDTLDDLAVQLRRLAEGATDTTRCVRGRVQQRRGQAGRAGGAADDRARRAFAAGDLELAGRHWVEGGDLAGAEEAGPGPAGRRVPLPGTPFARERYWITDDRPGAAPAVTDRKPASADPQADDIVHYAPSWEDQPPAPPAPGQRLAGTALLVGVAPDLADLLARRMERVVRLEPGDGFDPVAPDLVRLDLQAPDQVSQLFQHLGAAAGAVSSVLFVASPAGADHTPDGPARAAVFALLHLVRPLLRAIKGGAVRLVTVDVGSAVGEADNGLFGALSGFGKTLQIENRRIGYQNVLLETGLDPATQADALVATLAASGDDREVRFVQGRRQVKRIVALSAPAGRHPPSPLRPGGVYLITGGLGGLGRIFADAFARRCQATLILTGRSALTPEAARHLDALKQAGAADVHYQPTDITDAAAVKRLIAEVRARWGTLHGVVHAAGVIRDALFLAKTPEQITQVLAPKVAGTLNLDQALADAPLDFLVLFSSIAGIAGNMGQCDYAFANAFMDGFAEARQRRVQRGERHGRTVSINWPLWRSGGMQVDQQAERYLLETMGMVPLATETGLDSFTLALASDRPVFGVMAGHAAAIRRFLGIDRTEEAAAAVPLPAGPPDTAALRARTEGFLADILAKEVEVDVGRIDVSEPLEHYGIDSVMILSLTRCLEAYFGTLPKTLFFEYQSLEALVGYFLESHADRLASVVGPGAAEPADPGPAPQSGLAAGGGGSVAAPAAEPDGAIAIIGIAGRYPMAETLDVFWQNLTQARDCIREIPPERWNHRPYFDPDPDRIGKSYAKWGGFLDDVACFDAPLFRISPREAEIIDPQERLFLETAFHAIEDSGYRPGDLAAGNQVGVFAGVMWGHYQLFGPSADGQTPNSPFWSVANRVSYTFDFHGPSMAVDTACSSSLTSVHLACESLRNGTCRVAIAGGVNLNLHPNKFLILSQQRFAATDGRCRSFGVGGDGYVPGEGVGALVLKPLAQATRDGDTIHAIIRGSAVNHGGRTNGYTVPNPTAQAAVVRDALRDAGVGPETIGYLEAHGTGTALGDPIEIRALGTAFGGPDTVQPPVAIGSVKSNIGHLESAAGIAGITKVVLQMRHGMVAPSLHADTLNPNIDFATTPFRVQRALAPWSSAVGTPRRAGVSSFGAGGANAHVILEAWEPPSRDVAAERPQLIVLSAKTETGLRAFTERLVPFLRREDCPELEDIAFTLQIGRQHFEQRLALVVEGVETLADTLARWLDGRSADDLRRGSSTEQNPVVALMAGPSGASALDDLIAKRDLHQLAQLWVGGLNTVDWIRLHDDRRPRRISLPNRPFAKDRYWIDLESPGTGAPAEPRHPLLGRRIAIATKEVVHEQALSLKSLPWLADHQVFDAVVIPGAVYAAMAVAATATDPARSVVLGDFKLYAPLILTGAAAAATVQLIRADNGAEGGPEDRTVAVYSRTDPHGDWTRHAEGRAAPDVDDGGFDPSSIEALDRLKARLAGQALSTFYDSFDALGIHYGPAFRVVGSVWSGAGESLGEIILPESLAGHGLPIHPVLLDGCFQVVGAALPKDAGTATYLPIGWTRLRLRDQAGDVLFCHARMADHSTAGAETLVAELVLYDQFGDVVGAVEGLTLKRSTRAALLKRTDRVEDWLHEVVWQPRPLTEAVQPAKFLPSPTGLAGWLAEGPDRWAEERLVEADVRAFGADIERLARAYAHAALTALGWNRDDPHSPDLAGQLGVVATHRRLLDRLLTLVREADPATARDPRAASAAVAQRHPWGSAELALLDRCGGALARVLRGETDPLRLVFSETGASAATVYSDSPLARVYNRLFADTVARALGDLPRTRRLRVLEVGAGTGGTTASVLPVLPADRTDFVYTDISAGFFAGAEARFSADDARLDFRVLDIEKDPREQGFAAQSFDLVFASNVLHATRDIEETLVHCRRLLVPNGLLVLLEVLQPQAWLDLTFGLLEGWWRFADARRPHHALMAAESWQGVLADCGFIDAAVVHPWTQGVETDAPPQGVIVAQASPTIEETPGSWVIAADDGGLADRLAAALAARNQTVVVAGGTASGATGPHRHATPFDPTRREAWSDLLADREQGPPLRGVVHLGAAGGCGATALAQEMRDDMARATASALALCQAALSHDPRPQAGVWLVTRGAQVVGNEAGQHLAGTPLWGLGKTLALEAADVSPRMIDLDRDDDAALGALVDDLLVPGAETHIAYRNGERHTARLVRGRAVMPRVALPWEGRWRLVRSPDGRLDGVTAEPDPDRALMAGEVRVAIAFAGLNFRDVLIALDLNPEPNAELGGEFCGRVVAVAPDVTDVAVGDRVIGFAPSSFGPQMITRASLVVPVPSGLSDAALATIPVVFVTVWLSFELARLSAGDRVLIHAGTGGVGLAAIQLARAAGAEVFATASAAKQGYLRGLGIDHVFNSRDTRFAGEILEITNGRGVDVVLNSLTGEGFIEASLSCLATGGRFVEIAKLDIWSEAEMRAARPDVAYHVLAVDHLIRNDPERVGAALRQIVAGLREGTVRPLPFSPWSLAQTPAAMQTMQAARHIGKIVLAIPPFATGRLDPDRTYLITGGFGGIGLALALWLAERGARHIALNSRRPPTAAAQAVIDRLDAQGVQVHPALADVSKPDQVAGMLAALDRAAPPLAGIFHSVGVLRDGAIPNQSWEAFEAVLAPKALGAWALHQATIDRALDLFVLFSSTAGVIGNTGQANHAAANAFLDQLARHRRALGLPGQSIAWGPWAGLGEAEEQRERVAAQFQAAGIGWIDPDQGFAALEALLRQDTATGMVLPVDWSAFVGRLSHTPTLLDALVDRPAAASAAAKASSDTALAREIQSLAPAARQSRLADWLSRQVQAVLRLPDPADPGIGFFDLGMDSLTTIELSKRIEKTLGLKLESSILFDYPTVTGLASYLTGALPDTPARPAAPRPAVANQPIAIIGMAGRFPGCRQGVDGFWDLLAAGRSGVGPVPRDRWTDGAVGRAARNGGDPGVRPAGGFVDGIDQFDPGFFRISPIEAKLMDPQQRMLLETSWHALEDAGIDAETLVGSRTGVFAGLSSCDYRELMAEWGTDAANLHMATGTTASAAIGRISFSLGLQGPAITVDTACSASLVALHQACQALRRGEADLALTGGANALLTPSATRAFTNAGMLSPDGRCRTFDAKANGYVRGEGCGMVVLKRLAEAERDGDRILAVVRGSAVNQDGASAGLTAPNGLAQERVIADALADAGLEPAEIHYVEAHGTGTALGDPIEVRAAAAAYGVGRTPDRPLLIGSVKTNIGHLEAAAGIAGVIKTVLAMQHGVIPEHLNFETPSPRIAWADVPVRVTAQATPLPDGAGQPFRAGVSSFGFSGTNAHVILEAHRPPTGQGSAPAPASALDPRRHRLLPLSGKTPQALTDLAACYGDWLAGHPDADLADLAFSAGIGRSHFTHRAGVVFEDRAALQHKLAALAAGAANAGTVTGTAATPVKIAFVFSDGSDPAAGMGGGAYQREPVVRTVLDRCDTVIRDLRGLSLCEIMFGADAGAGSRTDAAWARPALFALQAAMVALFRDAGLTPAVVFGHGVGAYAAAYAAGGLDLEDGLRRIAAPGAADAETPAGRALAPQPLQTTLISAVTGLPIGADQVLDEAYWRRVAQAPVPLDQGTTSLAAAGVNLILELGPDLTLGPVIARTWAGDAAIAKPVPPMVSSLGRGRDDGAQIAEALATLYAHGASLSFAARFAGERRRKIALPTYPFQRKRYWVEPTPGHRGAAAGTHPLLGPRRVLPRGDVSFETVVSPEDHPWLVDHRIYGQTIFPAAGYVEIALAALGQAEGDGGRRSDPIALTHVQIETPLALDRPHTLQTLVNPDGTIEVFARVLDGLAETPASGAVRRVSARIGRPDPDKATADLPALRARCPNRQDVASLYQRFAEAGVAYGPAFQSLTAIHVGEGECLVELVLPAAAELGETWTVPPSVLDSAFQALAVGSEDLGPDTLLPIGMAQVCWFAPRRRWRGGERLFAHSRRRSADAQTARADIVLLDPAGTVLGSVEDLTMRRADRAVFARLIALAAETPTGQPGAGIEPRDAAIGSADDDHLRHRSRVLLKATLAKVAEFDVEQIDDDEPLKQYGLDSILAVAVTKRLEESFGELSRTLLFEFPTIDALSDYLIAHHRPALMGLFGPAPVAVPVTVTSVPAAPPVPVTEGPSVAPRPDPVRASRDDPAMPVPMDTPASAAGDIAIIGVSGRYPGAETLEAFWEILRTGTDCIIEVPRSRWDHDQFFAPDTPGMTNSRWGGFLDQVDCFDPLFFGISPREAETLDPQERLALESAYHALEDAGYRGRPLDAENRVGVFVGVAWSHYQLFHGDRTQMPKSGFWSIANRISYTFDFKGPSLPVDTACSSSLTALHLACESLKRGESRVALAGGVNLTLHPDKYVLMSQNGFFSSDGRCRAFGAGGDGYVPGEGVGFLVLKPLDRAVEACDRIHAVIKATAVNHGGKGSGFNVPSPTAQAAMIGEALQRARVDPASISYLEAHGTGTALGDPIEIRGLSWAFAEATAKGDGGGAGPRQLCAIGSVKTNIGHLEAAAGVAGVTKVLLQLRHGRLAPSLHAETLNPYIDFDSTPFRVQREPAPWAAPTPRRAGVSSFGAGGANAHVILEEHRPARTAPPLSGDGEGPHLLVFSARSEERLTVHLARILAWLESWLPTSPAVAETQPTLEAEARRKAEANAAAAHTRAVERIKAVAGRVLSVAPDEIDDREPFQDLGFEPVHLTALIDGLDAPADRPVTLRTLAEQSTVAALAGYLARPDPSTAPAGAGDRRAAAEALPQAEPRPPALSDIAYTLLLGREAMEERLAVVVDSSTALRARLRAVLDGDASGVYRGNTRRAADQTGLLIEGEEGQAFIRHVLQKRNLDKLARFWVAGVSVDWSLLYETRRPCISLPHYPFLREPHWVGDRVGLGVGDRCPERLHPLLGENTSDFEVQRFTTHLRADAFYLADHRLGAGAVLPAAAILEMARAAGERAAGQPVTAVLTTVWLQPVAVGAEGRTIDLRLYPEGDHIGFELGGFELAGSELCGRSGDDASRLFAEGSLLVGAAPADAPQQALDLDAVRRRCRDILDGEVCYRRLARRHLNYGPSFQPIRRMWRNDREVLVELVLPPTVKAGFADFMLHPSLLDGAFQAVSGLIDEEGLFTPFTLGAVHLFRPLTETCYAYARSEGDKTFSILVTDAAGDALVLMRDVGLRHWASFDPHSHRADGAVDTVAEDVVVEDAAPAEAPASAGTGSLRDQTLALLKGVLAQVAKLKPATIDSGRPLEAYGVDSVMVVALTREMETQFGPLSKTLLFEYKSLAELAEYFLKHHAERLATLFPTDEVRVRPAKEPTAAAPATTPVSRALIATGGRHRSRFSGAWMATAGQRDTVSQPREPIAIIGIAGRYPQANTLDAFWQNLLDGRDGITEIPPERWRHADVFDTEKGAPKKSYSKWGAFLDQVDRFDPLFFQINPRDAALLDPQERLFLETVHHTLEDAGYVAQDLDPEQRRVGVFVGVMWGQYQLLGLAHDTLTPTSAYWSIANRVSYHYDFQGPSMAVDTACSSSLTAIHLACESLHQGECAVAVAGGVNLTLHPEKYLLLSQYRFAASDGRCRSFGRGGDGYVPGEGVGAVLLKPLEQAVADGDHVHAVIKGNALNHGGKTNGYSVPNPNAQADLITEALRRAGVPPRTINYLEAHGTGTALGDPIEITGLAKAFGRSTEARGFCAIGSVKSNIGHLESAAGIAGVTKVVLQMKHRTLVPSIHAETLNPNIDFDATPFVVQRGVQAWEQAVTQEGGLERRHPRRAGVSSFGAGGSNAHLILEEHGSAPQPVESPGPFLFLLSAASAERLDRCVADMVRFLETTLADGGDARLAPADVAFTLQVGRAALSHRLAVVADRLETWFDRLVAWQAAGPAARRSVDGVFAGSLRDEDDGEPPAMVLDGEAGRAFIDIAIRTREFHHLARLWIMGVDLDWHRLYPGDLPRRVPLPTYPFARQRCWLPDVKAPGDRADIVIPAHLHPLVHTNTSTLREQRFSSRFGDGDVLVADHRIGGVPVLPGAACVEMARVAGVFAGETGVRRLTDIVWSRPLALNPGALSVDLSLFAEEDRIAFEIARFDEATEQRSLCCQGALVLDDMADPLDPPTPRDMAAIRRRCPQRIDAEACYALFKARGLDYGPAFRSIDALHCGDGEALAHLRLSEDTAALFDGDADALHPALVDGALQTVAGVLLSRNGDDDAGFLPYALDAVEIFAPLPTEAFAHATASPSSAGGGALVFDIAIAETTGTVCVVLRGFAVRPLKKTGQSGLRNGADKGVARTSGDAAGRRAEAGAPASDADTIFHAPIWRPAPLRAGASTLADGDGPLVLMTADQGFDADLGVPGPVLRLAPEASCDAIADAPRRVVFFSSDATVGATGDPPDGGRVLLPLFALVRHLIGLRPKAPVDVLIAGRFDGPSVAACLGEAMAGFARTVTQENPRLVCKSVVLLGVTDTEAAAHLRRELLADAWTDPDILHRSGQRLARARQAIAAPDAAGANGLRRHGVYLITGGLGGLGLLVADHLARTCQARLILTGRSATLSAAQADRLEALSTLGAEVSHWPMDATDGEAVEAVVAAVVARYGTLHGVIHGAGVLHDAFILKKQPWQVAEVLAPKIAGTLNLDRATRSLPLDWFVLFSSTVATLGNPGQCDYAFANAFMDRFAEYRQALADRGERAGRSRSIQWPLWRAGGMTLTPQLEAMVRQSTGLVALETGVGLAAFDRGLALPRPVFGVACGDGPKIRQALALTDGDA